MARGRCFSLGPWSLKVWGSEGCHPEEELMNGRQELGLEVGEMSHRYLKPAKVFKSSCYRLRKLDYK